MTIFLDIDGVMVPTKSWKTSELLDDGFPAFSLSATIVLQKIISKDTLIILTTSHKSRYSIKEWKEIFHKRDIQIKELIKLDDNINHLNRKDEILNYINVNKPTNFIIIDDDKSLNDLPSSLKDRLISTNTMIGLIDNHLNEINLILD